MDKLREVYRKALEERGETPDDSSPLVIILDNEQDREIIQSHIEEDFGESQHIDPESADDIFLKGHRLATGELECTILFAYHNGQGDHSVYFEATHLGEAKVQAVLRDLGPDDTLAVHLKGRDYREAVAKLRPYFVTHYSEPEEPHKPGEKYQDGDYWCVNAQVLSQHGLHMRPAGKIVEIANAFQEETEIFIQYKDREADARSIMSVITLCSIKGDTITFKARGPQTDEALDTLYKAVQDGLGEK